MLKRERYLSKIRPFYDVDLIKVLVGVRRCGKSEILRQIKEELLSQGVEQQQMIYMNFEDLSYSHLLEAKALNDFVLERLVPDKKMYLFFDEIQQVNAFERVLSSLKATQNVSIFITGSNANLLSGQLATLIGGRYVSFKIYPFSYLEAYDYVSSKHPIISQDEFFLEYLKWGGFPQRFDLQNAEQIRTYLNDVFASIVLKDISYHLKEIEQRYIHKIIQYVFNNNAKIFSPRRVYDALFAQDTSVQSAYVYTGIKSIISAQLAHECQRYDIKGKENLKFLEKYYVADLGLKTILSTNPQTDVGFSIETIIYNELISRGYMCYVGITYKGEVDFVVFKDHKKCYIQVCYYLASDEIIQREFGAFKSIRDFSPKYVLSLDRVDFSRDGIKQVNILDFLSEKIDLEFN